MVQRLLPSKWTLRSRLIALPLIAALPVLLLAFFLQQYQRDREVLRAREGSVQIARALASLVEAELLRVEAGLKGLATATELRSSDLAGFHQQAWSFATSANVQNVVLTDSSGRQVVNTARELGAALPNLGPNAPMLDVFRTGRSLFRVVPGALDGEFVAVVGIPVTVNDEVAFALAARLPQRKFDELLARQGLPPDWIAAVLDDEGRIAGRSVEGDRYRGHLAVQELREAMAARSGGSFDGYTIDRVPVVTSYSRAGEVGWAVAVGIPNTLLARSANEVFALFLAAALTVFVSAVLVAWMYGRSIGVSFNELRRIANAIDAHPGEPAEFAGPRLSLPEGRELSQALLRASARLRQAQARVDSGEITVDALQSQAQHLRRFYALLAHELRNFLAPASHAAEYLSSDEALNDPARTRRFAAALASSIAGANQLVADIVDVAKAQSGQLQVSMEPVDLAQVARDAANVAGPHIERRQHRLAMVIPASLPLCQGDRLRLVQVATNLIINAARYTPTDGQITVTVQHVGDRVQLSVADNGIGIEPSRLTQLFEMFSASSDRVPEGLGVGLFLSKQLMLRMGGELMADSRGPGQGATFTLSLPAS